uniref:Uncharacterized protein n=1 Tax=Cyanistes caeruleus TaxID=156563 RepID=A0A8C0Z921_CYACU
GGGRCYLSAAGNTRVCCPFRLQPFLLSKFKRALKQTVGFHSFLSMRRSTACSNSSEYCSNKASVCSSPKLLGLGRLSNSFFIEENVSVRRPAILSLSVEDSVSFST